MTAKPAAQLYVAGNERGAIVAPMHQNFAGICYEQEVPLVVENWRDSRVFGAAIHDALRRFSMHDRNLREYKKSDWPAYRASGVNTIKVFEQEFLRLEITALNETASLCDVTVRPPGERDIRLTTSFTTNNSEAETGRLILKIVDAARNWRP